ncbi:hypothetical protein RUM43_010934 [Polyplax serrata]|uniref:Uncharacterized protein n=1 Tax=Polyplax serrata TaxID=468196 RepID=A0AAN8NS48_POLSC
MDLLPRTNYKVTLIVPQYPCRAKEEEEDPDHPVCRSISIQNTISKPLTYPEPCRDVTRKKKKFDESKICDLPTTRKWDPEENIFRLWIPICRKKKLEEKICPEPFDPRLCVFCLGSLYKGGFVCDLNEKIPLIKKQSIEYEDEIEWRIGIATRMIVHKKCYENYIDRLGNKRVKESKTTLSDDPSDICGEARISEEEIIKKIPPIIPNFCLKKPIPPPVASNFILLSDSRTLLMVNRRAPINRKQKKLVNKKLKALVKDDFCAVSTTSSLH